MTSRQLFRKPISYLSPSFSFSRAHPRPRFLSSSPPPPPPPPPSSASLRASKILDRVPRPFRRYTDGLRHAPITHIVSFLILHEITAIVPLISLSLLFHYTQWLPEVWVEGRYVDEGVSNFTRYFRRKGWFGFDEGDGEGGREGDGGGESNGEERGRMGRRVVVEVATAYAITKVFLPVRILLSVWATPWFARVIMGRIGGLFGRGGNVRVARSTGAEVVGKDAATITESVKKRP